MFAIVNNIYLLTTAISRLVVMGHMTGSGGLFAAGFNLSDSAEVQAAIREDLQFNYKYLVGFCS